MWAELVEPQLVIEAMKKVIAKRTSLCTLKIRKLLKLRK
jgi:hypothetical protein